MIVQIFYIVRITTYKLSCFMKTKTNNQTDNTSQCNAQIFGK